MLHTKAQVSVRTVVFKTTTEHTKTIIRFGLRSGSATSHGYLNTKGGDELLWIQSKDMTSAWLLALRRHLTDGDVAFSVSS